MLELIPMPEERQEAVNVEPGSIWEFVGPEHQRKPRPAPRGRYEMIGVADHLRNMQELVVLRGRRGILVCSFVDFASKFRLVSSPAPVAPVVNGQRAAGDHKAGIGV